LKLFLGAIEGFTFSISKANNFDRPNQVEIADKVSLTRGTPSTTRRDRKNTLSKSKRQTSNPRLPEFEFDNDKLLKLSRQDVKKIQKYFFLFSRNRSNYLSEKYHKKHAEELEKATQMNHQPSIDDKSRQLIKELHTKLSENQIPHYEFLLFKGREYERRMLETKNENEVKANSECTFFPDTSVTSSFYVKHKDKIDESIYLRNTRVRYMSSSTKSGGLIPADKRLSSDSNIASRPKSNLYLGGAKKNSLVKSKALNSFNSNKRKSGNLPLPQQNKLKTSAEKVAGKRPSTAVSNTISRRRTKVNRNLASELGSGLTMKTTSTRNYMTPVVPSQTGQTSENICETPNEEPLSKFTSSEKSTRQNEAHTPIDQIIGSSGIKHVDEFTENLKPKGGTGDYNSESSDDYEEERKGNFRIYSKHF
jgi:hypothetical protein